MQFDLKQFLDGWPYDPDHPTRNYRVIEVQPGRYVLQVREPLGIQQMEYDGRPDGFAPHGHPTWLDYYSKKAEEQRDLELTPDDCQRLMQEGVMFYQRYLILYQMNDWNGVVRDTARNLVYFDFLRRHGPDRDSSLIVEQYRPYVIRINAIANTNLLWREGKTLEAINRLRVAIRDIEQLESVPTSVFKLETERSIQHLREVISDFEGRRPIDRLEVLKRQQQEAIQTEDFERAAKLRDQIHVLESERAL